jgi:hypothetical protein
MKTIVRYGLLAGLVTIALMLAGIALFGHSLWTGYAAMLVGLSLIFVGVKRYRDDERGGTIGFPPAFGIGMAMVAIAGVAYVVVFEAYLALTHYRFMDDYIVSALREREAAGASMAELAKETADLDQMRPYFANPMLRIPMTFVEILPVGVLVALASALGLRNSRTTR